MIPTLPSRYWRRRVTALALPIILSNLSIPLVGAVDTAVVGHLGDAVYIGAVALGAVIFSIVFWSFGFLRMSTSGLVAQSLGRGDSIEIRAVLYRALLTAAAGGLVLTALQWPLGLAAVALTDAGDALREQTLLYFSVRVWGAPATLANYAILGCLVGLQRTGAVLIHQLTLNLVNVVLDLAFVLGLGYQVGGVAAASVLAECAAAVTGLALLAGRLRGPVALPWRRVLARERLRELLFINTNIMVRTLCLTAAFFYFTAMGTRQGEIVLAANAVLMHLQSFLAYGLDGFSHAAETLAGNAYGARRQGDFDAAVAAATRLAFALALLCCLAYYLGGGLFIDLLTDIAAVREQARDYLPWLVISPLVSVWSFLLDGVFIGTTRTREMRNAMILSLLIFLVSGSVLVEHYGNTGLWGALLLFMAVRAVTLGWYYPALRRAAAAI